MRLALGLALGGPKTSSLSSLIGIVVFAGRSLDERLVACGPEKRGAGGSGRLGLPYLEEGVPGLGLPLMSAGSYGMFDGGGREDSDEVRDNVYDDRGGEALAGMYGR